MDPQFHGCHRTSCAENLKRTIKSYKRVINTRTERLHPGLRRFDRLVINKLNIFMFCIVKCAVRNGRWSERILNDYDTKSFSVLIFDHHLFLFYLFSLFAVFVWFCYSVVSVHLEMCASLKNKRSISGTWRSSSLPLRVIALEAVVGWRRSGLQVSWFSDSGHVFVYFTCVVVLSVTQKHVSAAISGARLQCDSAKTGLAYSAS